MEKKTKETEFGISQIDTYRCYSATCAPAQLSLLSDAIAKYSSLEESEKEKREKQESESEDVSSVRGKGECHVENSRLKQ